MTDPLPPDAILQPFATLDDFEDMVGPATSRTTLDLLAASATIRSYCGWFIWPFVYDDEVVVENPGGGDVLLMPTGRLMGVTSVSETARSSGAEPVELDVDTLEWSTSGVVQKLDGCTWTRRRRGVTAVIDHGYQDSPDELKALCVDLAARAAASPSGSIRSQVGQRSEAWAQGPMNGPAGGRLMSNEKDLLAPYVRVS